MDYRHVPVLLNEVLEYLQPKPGENFIDCTMGGLGYSMEISQRILPGGKVIAVDLDKIAIANAEDAIKITKRNNIILIHDNFKNLYKIYQESFGKTRSEKLTGIIFDLGLSTAQLEDRNRGFSFQLDDPLDMAFGQTQTNAEQEQINTNSTKYIVNKWPEKELAKIIFEYGEERYSRNIAQGIIKTRKYHKIESTKELVEIIRQAIPKKYEYGKIHFATRTFQALRIATNDELNNLSKALIASLEVLAVGGRIGVVSYHSLEDRIVKRFFREESKDCICPKEMPECRCGHKAGLKIITKKIVTAAASEIKNNPRARSAKLRVAEKI